MHAYLDKYRGFIDSYGWTPESFAEDYPHRFLVSPDARPDLVTAGQPVEGLQQVD
jgi:hypothetical protein